MFKENKVIKSGTFAEACYNMNSILELKEMYNNEADSSDMKQWNITPDEWKENIALAIEELESDEA